MNVPAQDLGGDLALKRLLVPGQGWELVAEGLAFADAPMSDHNGNFYYCDMRGDSAGIYRVAPGGNRTKVSDESVSGMKFGADGKLYACQGAKNRLIAIDLKSKEVKTITEDVKPNDLVVTHKGYIYFTETGKKQVTFVNAKTGQKKVADTGITAPNGIALSPDQSTLAVSDVRGVNVWTFRIESDGRLTAKAPYMTMRTEVDPTQKGDGRLPVYKTVSGGDGMSTDVQGRYYVATALGVQVFDPTGRECGLLPKPHTKGMTSVNVGGPNGEYLYATLGDKIYRRKIQANAFYPYQGPVEPQAAK
ncbi:MAG: SMP-30/gluconolactonase/LRE family protein [Verrucomicrobiota bacterium]